jgi:hypothetical protein
MKTDEPNQPQADRRKPKKLIILQGARPESEVDDDAKWLLLWLIKRLSIDRKKHCVFEFCYPGKKAEIPTRKAERVEFLASHITALCDRLRLHRPGEEIPESKVIALQFLNIPGEKTYRRHLAEGDPKSGLVGMGRLACECLSGDAQLKRWAGAYCETLPAFQRVGLTRAWISRDPVAALYDPNLAVDLSQGIWYMARGLGIEMKMDHSLKMFPYWSYYDGLRSGQVPISRGGKGRYANL